MKKLLWILVLSLLFCSTGNAAKYGKGELKLSPGVVDYFIKYIRGKGQEFPADFYVTIDGYGAIYWKCSQGPSTCLEGDLAQDVLHCERTTGKECKKFARKRTIKWKNGINKSTKINSKWSDDQIKAKLTELGFLEGTTTTQDETKYPKSLFPVDSQKKKNWDEFKKYDESKEWPFSAWAEVRSKKDAFSYEWTARKTLKEAIKYTLDECDKRRKEYKKDYKKSEICIVHYLNGKETTDDEKIKYAEQYYGKELASKSFKKNSWILKNKSSLKKPDGDIVKQIKDLKELYDSGVLTKEEFEKAKKKLLN